MQSGIDIVKYLIVSVLDLLGEFMILATFTEVVLPLLLIVFLVVFFGFAIN